MDQLPTEEKNLVRKRGVWRGILAGLIAHLIGTLVVSVSYFFLAPFIWRGIDGAPYDPWGKLDANSGEWLVLQCAASAIAFFSGAAAAKWSSPKSWIAAGLYIFVQSMCSFFAQLPNTDVLWRKVFWTLSGPLCAWAGAWIMKRRERR